MDVLIFDRSKKPIELTEVGKRIVAQAKNIVNESHRIQDIVDQQKGFIGGEFKLGIIPTVMPTLLPMFLKSFIKKFPKVKLKIEELTTEEIMSRLNEGCDQISSELSVIVQNHDHMIAGYSPVIPLRKTASGSVV